MKPAIRKRRAHNGNPLSVNHLRLALQKAVFQAAKGCLSAS